MQSHDEGLVIDQTQAATITTRQIDMRGFSRLYVHIVCGEITGTLELHETGHADLTPHEALDADGNQPLPSPAGSALNVGVHLFEVQAPFVEIAYTHGSGTGALQVAVFKKE